ncbi:MAG: hypothetical protein CVT80_08455 [Alphaproteobacteria bacterium HGW-Alphaproteobacteria-2]|nr:MAG: hypothetical protein CVT80_08455 [Alphaproteobacteria bacterium HGW-Alphaproteobacteria-2]
MFVRVTHYRLKPGSIDAAKQLLEGIRPKIMALPGMIQFVNAVNPDGSGCVFSINESRQISDGNDAAVQAIWAAFRDHLAAPPTAEGYDVFADWRK